MRCFRLALHGSTSVRPTASIEPLASKGTTMRIGRLGNAWPHALALTISDSSGTQHHAARVITLRLRLHDQLAHHFAGLEHAMRARRFGERNAVIDRHVNRAL